MTTETMLDQEFVPMPLQVRCQIHDAILAAIEHDAPEYFDPDEEHDLKDLGIEVPEWVNHHQSIGTYDVAAIAEGGCASGAWMPAVTYWQALETMHRYGEDVMDYLQGVGIDWTEGPDLSRESWAGLACRLVSLAVECWAHGMESEIEDLIAERVEMNAMQITIGADYCDGRYEWRMQTGDNSFSGPAYGHRYWGVAEIHSASDADAVAAEAIDQIEDQIASMPPDAR